MPETQEILRFVQRSTHACCLDFRATKICAFHLAVHGKVEAARMYSKRGSTHVLTNAPCFRGLGEFWLDLKILHSMLLRQHATVVVAHCARQHAQGAPWCVQISQRQLLKPDAAQAHSHSCCGKAPSVSSAAVLAASASSTKLLGGAFGSSDVTLCLGACFGVSRRVHHSFGASKPQSLAA